MIIDFGDERLPQRFWDKVYPEPNTGCWLWGAATFSATGYAQFEWQGRTRTAHRVAYESLVGPVAAPLVLDHLCRQRPCVHPGHLRPSTQRENILRGGGASARHARKTECASGHPLTPDNVYSLSTRPGARVCRTCKIERERQRRRRPVGTA